MLVNKNSVGSGKSLSSMWPKSYHVSYIKKSNFSQPTEFFLQTSTSREDVVDPTERQSIGRRSGPKNLPTYVVNVD